MVKIQRVDALSKQIITLLKFKPIVLPLNSGRNALRTLPRALSYY